MWIRQTGQYGGMGLAEIADRLYGVHPGEFTHSRDDEVREAKAAGDPALAAQVKTLRRPSTRGPDLMTQPRNPGLTAVWALLGSNQ